MIEPINAIQQLIKLSVATEETPLSDIKKVYFGDPVLIPESSLPAISINPKEDDYIRRGSRYDQKEHTIEIRLVYNQKMFFGKGSDDPERVFIVEDCLKKVGKVKSDLQSTDDHTICGIIQKNHTLPFTDDDMNVLHTATDARVGNVVYQLTQMRGYPTYEAIIQVLVTNIGDR